MSKKMFFPTRGKAEIILNKIIIIVIFIWCRGSRNEKRISRINKLYLKKWQREIQRFLLILLRSFKFELERQDKNIFSSE